jgi:hypothetical protein
MVSRTAWGRGTRLSGSKPLYLNGAFSCLNCGLTSLRLNPEAAANHNHDVMPRFRRIMATSPGNPEPSIRSVAGSGTVFT